MTRPTSRLIVGSLTAATLALTIAPASALAQGNSPANRQCPQGQVPNGNSGYCIPNPGQGPQGQPGQPGQPGNSGQAPGQQGKAKSTASCKQSLGSGVFRNICSGNRREGRKFRVVKKNGKTYNRYSAEGCRTVRKSKRSESGKIRSTRVCKTPAEMVLVG